jgi:hypothetical protein
MLTLYVNMHIGHLLCIVFTLRLSVSLLSSVLTVYLGAGQLCCEPLDAT